jgi:arylsulfatase A-like enzyme
MPATLSCPAVGGDGAGLRARSRVRARTSAAAAASAWLLACGSERPPDVVIVTWDTVRADAVGAAAAPDRPYAGPDATSADPRPARDPADTPTPRLDALAREGVAFTEARSPVAITLPAHASLLTGLPPHRHGARDNGEFPLPDGPPALAERLAERGYATAAFVSAAVLARAFGLARGFAHYDDGLDPDAPQRTVAARSADRTVDAALAWLAGVPAGQPIFVWLHVYSPHRPWQAPEPFARRFDPYTAEIAFADAETGRLLDGLADASRLERALVVVTSDHGEGLGEHGEGTHSFFAYDSTLRIPLVFWAGERSGAAFARGARIGGPASLLDVADTLLDLLGAPGLGGDGRSLAASLAGGAPVPPRVLALESVVPALDWSAAPVFGLIDEDGTGWFDGPSRERYELAADPAQTRNRYRAADADRADALFAAIDRDWPPRRSPVALDPATREQLEQLGYASGSGAAPEVSTVDARDRIDAYQFTTLEAESLDLEETLRRVDALEARHGALLALARFRADTLAALARPVQALRVLEAAALRHPDASALRDRIAALRGRLDRQRALAATIRDALARDPAHPTAERDLALTLHQLEEWDEAVALYERVLARDPDDDPTRANLARLWVARGEPGRALAALAPGRARAPHHPALDCVAGRILERDVSAVDSARAALGACAEAGGALSAHGRALLASSPAPGSGPGSP